MRILHVIHSLDPRSGGPSHAIRDLVRAQVAGGLEVSLLANTVQSAEPWAPREEYVRRLENDDSFAGSELVLARSYGRRSPWRRFAYSPQARNWLKRRLQGGDSRPDVVHIHGIFSHITTTAARLAQTAGIPYIVRPAGTMDPAGLRDRSRALKRLFVSLFLRRDLEQAAFVQVTSAAEAAALADWVPRDKVRTIPHGVTCPSDDLRTARAAFQAAFPQVRGRRIVLFLARLHPIKRGTLAVQAVAALRQAYPDVLLLIAGHDAGDQNRIVEAVREAGLDDQHVLLTGFLAGELKSGAYATADVFLLPSRHENHGVAVVEAMAHGVPVLVTQGVASHVYVEASGCGATALGTPEALAQGLRHLLEADRDEWGQRGRSYVAQNLSWPSVVHEIDQMYRDAIDRSSVTMAECS